MADLYSLIKDTVAFKTVKCDKEAGRLSHAYLLVCADKEKLKEYLKIFARLVLCKEDLPCYKCRTCNLIGKEEFADLIFYPRDGETMNVDDVNDLIEQAYIKPIEGERKVFILTKGEGFTPAVQNKLLKTLEEPPKNVIIFIGATSPFNLLSTVKSRMRKLNIPPFPDEKLFGALKEDCPDTEKLKTAIACGDGTVGKALSLYEDANLESLTDLISDMVVNMKSSRDLLGYSVKIVAHKSGIEEFLSVMQLTFKDMLYGACGKAELIKNREVYYKTSTADGYNEGAIVYALDKISEAQKRLKFNANPSVLTEWLLFQILEGRYKWRKL